MRTIILTITKCPLCGNYVERVKDKDLIKHPDLYNAEFVVTHSGHKQYIHSTCWNEMIKKQKYFGGK